MKEMIRPAQVEDAPIVHAVMFEAFSEYLDPPSSALDETVKSVESVLGGGEQALIYYKDARPCGIIRFIVRDEDVYFFRLAVVPGEQNQGIAKKLTARLENDAKSRQKKTAACKVRLAAAKKNIRLYRSLGYTIGEESIVHKPDGTDIKVAVMKKKNCVRAGFGYLSNG
ncbi:GNAT family N-acetyltransferase [Terrilactibacillus sp. S3-3]|nr:GNAT family N-acetyltransferase [Terrilactibacillus sp. S3-3]